MNETVLQVPAHGWIRADCKSTKCHVCHKKIKTLTGKHCVWCHEMVRISVCLFVYSFTPLFSAFAYSFLCLSVSVTTAVFPLAHLPVTVGR